jgi:hypothetical protein
MYVVLFFCVYLSVFSMSTIPTPTHIISPLLLLTNKDLYRYDYADGWMEVLLCMTWQVILVFQTPRFMRAEFTFFPLYESKPSHHNVQTYLLNLESKTIQRVK